MSLAYYGEMVKVPLAGKIAEQLASIKPIRSFSDEIISEYQRDFRR